MTDKTNKADFQPGRGYSKADWDAVSDSPEATGEELGQARSFAEAFPELAEKMRCARGPQKAPTKVSVTLRLDGEVVERFRASGKS